MTVTVLQISDPHFGTEQPAVVQALVDLAVQLQPELVVWSGDITQRARRSQFDAAAALAQRLAALTGTQQLAIPGNHDLPLFNLPARLLAPYRGFQRAFGPSLAPVYRSDSLLVIGVKTTRRWRHKDGEVSPDQAAAVALQLRTAQGQQLRVVVVHQPLVALMPSDRANLLHGRAQAIAAWHAAGADLVLGGHIHLPYVMELTPQADGQLPHRPHLPHDLHGARDGLTPRDPLAPHVAASGPRLWTAQAGTAVSRRVRPGAPNSVNVLRWTPQSGPLRTAVVERWDHPADGSTFSLVARHRLPLGVKPPQG